MEVTDVLIKARKILSDPRRWGKGAYKDGECYCAIGAVAAASGCNGIEENHIEDTTDEFVKARDALAKYAPPSAFVYWREWRKVVDFNDAEVTTYEDVQKLFSDAINGELAAQES